MLFDSLGLVYYYYIKKILDVKLGIYFSWGKTNKFVTVIFDFLNLLYE